MSFNELIILLVIALILFGPEDLPDVARAIGKVVFEVKKLTADMTKEFQEAVNTPSNVLKKTFDEAINPSPPKKSKQDEKGSEKAPATSVAAATEPSSTVAGEQEIKKSNNDDEELLTYDEDPLAELPQDMVSYENRVKQVNRD